MPNYEYECTHCKHRFEAFQKITDSPLDKCPKCQHKVKRLIGSGSGIIFKGRGFYATDYRKGNPPSKPASCPKADQGCGGCHPHD
ncbi:MAG: zinc ribbon domain-containing protein [Candidatus Omnitrophica bacterium]|nr:zinc ribbon domain-containing protein [Candidatus Omnitrophota bacterium]